MLKWVANRYPGVPILITENGTPGQGPMLQHSAALDSNRPCISEQELACITSTFLHCSLSQRTVLHRTSLYCTALHRPALHCNCLFCLLRVPSLQLRTGVSQVGTVSKNSLICDVQRVNFYQSYLSNVLDAINQYVVVLVCALALPFCCATVQAQYSILHYIINAHYGTEYSADCSVTVQGGHRLLACAFCTVHTEGVISTRSAACGWTCWRGTIM